MFRINGNIYISKFILLLFWAVIFQPSVAQAFDPMLPRVYSPQADVSGWLMSEKLDGVRGYWDGHQLYSKNGHLLHPPPQFIKNWPDFPLEGELWGGRNTFERTASIVKNKQPHNGWLDIKFAIFDAPEFTGGFTQRIAHIQNWFHNHASDYAFIIEQTLVRDSKHLQEQLAFVERSGGEGLIVRKADAAYVSGRNRTILKVKTHQDAEATVVAHLEGQGRNSSRMGALLVKLDNGTIFKLGSGFSNEDRLHPPAIGETITFKYYGTYPSGIPKFPSFLRIRQDATL